ncbi:efflux RND transporter periplasmic adaptor subunit [Maricaulis sp.]|uniref:efflux RND transporter periplasmic adaptor subunit n=1 Tax=Maricaulis sp. TaxID=1486257 RepID=UPI002B26EF4D|nr:efflux RND transporter periplasmic adaptor subunit [Maricaulis sp.]
MKRIWIGVIGLVVLAAAGWWWMSRGADSAGEIVIETHEVTQGEVRRIVAASGAVRALVTVEVGSQLSGQIESLYADFNDTVEAGQVIAQLNPETYETRIREAEANRATAAATLALQRANRLTAEANARSAQQEYDRIRALFDRGISAQAALDNALTAQEAAQANLAVSDAQIRNAQAVLAQRDATLEGVQIDLERTTIRAPINGIVVDRAVDEGQTVAASLSAPTLFTIAQDLGQVQIDAQVDEADIGQISEGQPVSFTVDAYQGLELEGVVEQIRLAPQTLNNVVTYTVVISATNPGQRLLPGMTANMDIITGERTDVLTVPNSALRFRPSPALESRSQPVEAGGQRGGRPGGGRGGPGGGRNPMAQMAEQLELTQDQQERAGAIFRQVFGRMAAAAQSGETPDRAAAQAEITRELQAVFTPEQMTRYREIQREMRETRSVTLWVLEDDGTLAERRVRVGINDTQQTEVVGGQLAAGEAVITRAREVRE